MIFGYIVCDRCGNKVEVDTIDFHRNRTLCSDCSKCDMGKICADCKIYDLVNHICTYEQIERAPEKVCCSTRVKWGVLD